MGSVDRLRITVDEERQAVVGQELIGVSVVDETKRNGSPIASELRSELSGDGICVVSLFGEHDLYTAPRVQEALRDAVATGATTVVDLTETTFLDSTMLHVFLVARNELRDGGRLLLVTDDVSVKRVFEVTGIDRFFDFHVSRRAAEEEARSA